MRSRQLGRTIDRKLKKMRIKLLIELTETISRMVVKKLKHTGENLSVQAYRGETNIIKAMRKRKDGLNRVNFMLEFLDR